MQSLPWQPEDEKLKKPGLHLEQSRPVTPGLQKHWPANLLQVWFKEPTGSQLQAKQTIEKKWYSIYSKTNDFWTSITYHSI